MYVYVKKGLGVWTVGFFDPKGKWQPESDLYSPQQAAERVAWLNGKQISTFDSDRLSFNELLHCLQTDLWDPNNKPVLGRIKNIIFALSRNYTYVDQVSQKEFLRYRNAGVKTWTLFLDLVSKAKKKQEEFLNL
jgi:hypothetical protein